MKILTLCTVMLFAISAQAQSVAEEINSQVWKKFIEGYNSFDTDKFMSVYSRDVVRVPVDEMKIFNFSEYRMNIHRENQFNKNYRIKANIELRFTKRIHEKDEAFEQGIFKITLRDNTGNPATLYSKFQVYLKKESNTWKIVYDSDNTEGGTISEKDFASAEPL